MDGRFLALCQSIENKIRAEKAVPLRMRICGLMILRDKPMIEPLKSDSVSGIWSATSQPVYDGQAIVLRRCEHCLQWRAVDVDAIDVFFGEVADAAGGVCVTAADEEVAERSTRSIGGIKRPAVGANARFGVLSHKREKEPSHASCPNIFDSLLVLLRHKLWKQGLARAPARCM